MSGSGQGSPWLHHACLIDVLKLQKRFHAPARPLENCKIFRGQGVTLPSPGPTLGPQYTPAQVQTPRPLACTSSNFTTSAALPAAASAKRLLKPQQPDASRVQLVLVHLCGASPYRWVLARRVCACVKPHLHNKGRPNNSYDPYSGLNEHTCIGVNEGTLLRSG